MTFSNSDAALQMLALDLAMVAFSLFVLHLAQVTRRGLIALGSSALLWLLLLDRLLRNEVFSEGSVSGPGFLALIFVFVGLVGVIFRFTPLRLLVDRLGSTSLLQLQGIRVFFGAGFLVFAVTEQLPPLFGVLDGLLHVTAGFLGLLAASLQAGSSTVAARRALWLAHLWGLTDILVVASTLALVLLPELTPHHAMMYAVFLPAPIWLWAHVVGITRELRRVSC